MKKLYTAIILIALALCISCDEKIAEVGKRKTKVTTKKELQEEIKRAIKAHGNNANLNYIDTSRVTDMSRLFENNTTFNGDISKWDTSSVTTMRGMFCDAISFNQSLNSWDVSSVTDMRGMFRRATSFNQLLNSWDVSKATDMYAMFGRASAFNQPLNNWAVSEVTNMSHMFFEATTFNQSLNSWTVLSVEDMNYMFYGVVSSIKTSADGQIRAAEKRVICLTRVAEYKKIISQLGHRHDKKNKKIAHCLIGFVLFQKQSGQKFRRYLS